MPDVRACPTRDAKEPGNAIILVGGTGPEMGGSLYQQVVGLDASRIDAAAHGHGPNRGMPPSMSVPRTHLKLGPTAARMVHQLMLMGLVRSAHDCSEGGVLVALAEMLIGGSTPARPIGAAVDLSAVPGAEGGAILGRTVAAFAETPRAICSKFGMRMPRRSRPRSPRRVAAGRHRRAQRFGALELSENLLEPLPVAELACAWSSPLDW